ncbi:MAG TPA: ATP-binding protein [Parafilimonas sp.]|nr:ATP-binding protein [Parafilimonas sp.]
MKQKFFLFIVCLIPFSFWVTAQSSPAYKVRSLTIEDGLPQGFITGFVQDKQGFIWIATRDGLARYDGKEFKVFYHDGADSTSLASSVVRYISIDRANNIWIQYDNNAIDVLNPVTETIKHLSKEYPFTAVTTDKRDEIFSTVNFDKRNDAFILNDYKQQHAAELLYLNPQQKKLIKIALPPNEAGLSITSDTDGNIWVSSQRSLYMFRNEKLNKIYELPQKLQSELHEVDSLFIENAFRIKNNNLLFFGTMQSLWILNLRTNNWKSIHLPPSVATRNSDVIFSPTGDAYLKLAETLYKINSDTSLSLIFTNTLKYPNILASMIDRNNVFWIGTNTFGVRMIDLNESGFASYKIIKDFFYDVIPAWGNIAVNKNFVKGFNNDFVAGRSCLDKNGNLWISNFFYNELDGQKLSFNSLTKITKQHAYVYNIEDSLPDIKINRIVDVAFDAEDRCWVLLPFKGELAGVDLEHKKLLSSYTFDYQHNVNPLAFVAQGNILWIVYFNGLESFNTITKRFTSYRNQPGSQTFRDVRILSAAPDPINKNILWISTISNGLIRFNSSTLATQSFTTKEGLPNNTVYAIIIDKHGNFWCSSNKGIFRFNPRDYSVLSFTEKDGLQGNEFNGYQYIHFPDDKIAFGGTEGWTMFDPDSVRIDQYQPEIALTDIDINNQPVSKYDDWKGRSVVSTNTMHLSYNQNFLTFRFVALESNAPEKLQYRYQLTGIDKGWINAGTQNSANYTDLSPGTYDLKLNATNTDGIWSNHIKTVHIVIAPPWWQTWWAYVLYAVATACIIWLVFSARLKQAKAKQEIALKQKETEQLKAVDELKSRFFSNITHEFRTPLSLILSPVEQMQQHVNDAGFISRNLTVVHRNAQQLLRLINQLLDMSKIESGNMLLSFSRGDIKLFIEECVHSFYSSAKEKNIDLKFYASATEKEYLFDTDKIEKITFNLLSNAIKFTPENGNITVHLSIDKMNEHDNQLRLQVSDSGIGIDEEYQPYIFNRFYQIDTSSTRKYEGTGIGLALVKELVQLMNGSIELKSKKGEGTTFIVALPVQTATTEMVPQWNKTMSSADTLTVKIINTDTEVETAVKNNLPLILIVEDNDELRAFIAECLQKKYRTLSAANGKQALQIAKEELPEIIISDIMMPEMDGYALCKEIKSNVATDHIALILLTAKTAHESVMEGLISGADDYVTKPFHFDELELRIHNILQRQDRLRLFFQSQLKNPEASIQTKETENSFIANLYLILDEHLDDTTLSVEKLATKAAVSSRTLNRKLSSIVGLSANELIKQYRLKRSIEFLKSGNNVSETAYSVGFETHSHFTTSFKSFFGVTPSEYLHQNQ